MNTFIVSVQNPLLKQFIQYFIFFGHQSAENFSYQTFPNTNLCLAIYKENRVDYKPDENLCTVGYGQQSFSSRLFGFHKQPFEVQISAAMEQTCILFHPGALRAFTDAPYSDLMNSNQVFTELFNQQDHLLEQVFECADPYKRALLLENFLLKKLVTDRIDDKLNFLFDQINHSQGDITIYELSGMLNVNESTLYRSFNASIGQSPKDFIKTVRFRNALTLLLKNQYRSFTELSYDSRYFDQSHFIRDLKKRSGMLPNLLSKNVKLEQTLLAWIVTTA